MTSTGVNQSKASAGGDITGRDKTINNYYSQETAFRAIEKLARKLEDELKTNNQCQDTVENFAYYKKRKVSSDGIVGLEAKLKKVGRQAIFEDAIEKKILFEKLIDKWSLYASAQEIFAHLLAKIERTFSTQIKPSISEKSNQEIDQQIDTLILEKVENECSKVEAFHVNYNIALGMLYWLADNCFGGWHRTMNILCWSYEAKALKTHTFSVK